ncbi:hypothetical protein ACFLY9_01315 [Patescibacteria group bacterium]
MTKKQKAILTILVVIHIILITLTLTGKLNTFFNDASLRKGKAADFFAVYQAGDNILRGESVYLDTEGISTPYSFPFRYLPFIGYSLGVILNSFSPFTAYYIWIIVYEILLGVNIYLTWKLCKVKQHFLFAIVPWLLFSPYLIEVFMGQWTFLLSSLIFYSIYGILKNNRAKYLYILAPLVKPNALILVPLFLKLKKYKVLILTALGIFITSTLYFLFFKDDIQIFMQNFQDVLYSHGGNLGFKSLYYLLAVEYLSIPIPRVLFFGFVALLGALTTYLTFKYKNIALSLTLWICFYFMIYKDVWEHHYVLLMPVFSLLASLYGVKLRKEKYKYLLPIVISFILIALPTPFILQCLFVKNPPAEPDTLSPLFVIPYHSMKIIGVIMLYTWSALNIRRLKNSVN